MPDPLESLQSLRTSTPGTRPLPAAEVRRRGDRLRRRNTAGLVLGSAAVVAAVAVGSSWLGSPRPDAVPPATSGPSPTASPTASPATDPQTEVTRIPAAFPLNDGWPQPQDGGITEPSPDYMSWFGERETTCGERLPMPDAAGRLTTIWTGTEESRSRELLTFESVAAARQFSAEVKGLYAGCETTPAINSLHADRGDETWEVRTYLRAGDEQASRQQLVQVTRLGHVLFISYGSDGGNDIDLMSYTYLTESTGVLEAVCEQIAGACEQAVAPEQPTSTLTAYGLHLEDAPASEQVGQGDVPDIAIGDGLPDMTGDGGELLGPAADVVGVDRLLVCGSPVIEQDGPITGRLAASSSGPEYLGFRQVIGYEDAAAAQAQMEHVRSLFRGCDRHATESGDTDIVWTEVGAATGYDSVTAGYGYYLPGEDTIAGTGGEIVQLTRVGRAILVVGSSGEYSGADSIRSAAPDLTGTTKQLAPLLCSFTAAGC